MQSSAPAAQIRLCIHDPSEDFPVGCRSRIARVVISQCRSGCLVQVTDALKARQTAGRQTPVTTNGRCKRCRFFRTRDQPDSAARSGRTGLGQRHRLMFPADAGHRDVVDRREHGIARHQRRRVAIGTEAKLHHIQRRWPSGSPLELLRVLGRRPLEIAFHRYGAQPCPVRRCTSQ